MGWPCGIDTFAPSLSRDLQARAWWGRAVLRAASSPGGNLGRAQALRDTT